MAKKKTEVGTTGGAGAPGPAAAGETKKRNTKPRAMNLCLVRDLTKDEAETLTNDQLTNKFFVVLADESANLKTEADVTKWLKDNNYEGELNVAAFRRGYGKQEGLNGRMVRRRYKTEPVFKVD